MGLIGNVYISNKNQHNKVTERLIRSINKGFKCFTDSFINSIANKYIYFRGKSNIIKSLKSPSNKYIYLINKPSKYYSQALNTPTKSYISTNLYKRVGSVLNQ